MTSNKLSARRSAARKPPICISKPKPPPPPPPPPPGPQSLIYARWKVAHLIPQPAHIHDSGVAPCYRTGGPLIYYYDGSGTVGAWSFTFAFTLNFASSLISGLSTGIETPYPNCWTIWQPQTIPLYDHWFIDPWPFTAGPGMPLITQGSDEPWAP